MPSIRTEHNWTLPDGISPFLRVTEQSEGEDQNGEAKPPVLWITEKRHGSMFPLNVDDAAWLGQALLDFAATAHRTSCNSPHYPKE